MASQLKQRFIDHLAKQNVSTKSRQLYLFALENLAKFYNRSPDRLRRNEVQNYLNHLIRNRKYAWSTVKIHLSAYRYFYNELLGLKTNIHIPSRAKIKRLAAVVESETFGSLPN